MKAVLISIQPKWVEKIALGKKTIEVRKNRPNLGTPFKCYIYETKDKRFENIAIANFGGGYFEHGCGKVIGEFVCDMIDEFTPSYFGIKCKRFEALYETRLTVMQMQKYLKGKTGYGWHISDLKIYDKPEELGEFFHYCGDDPKCDGCEAHYYSNTECGKEDYCCSIIEGCKPLKRPPQSWCYVEDLQKCIKR